MDNKRMMNMYKTLSNIQKQKFLEFSGTEHVDSDFRGSFSTSKPYNSAENCLSPWNFAYIFDDTNGYLVCELAHRMTNNRVYGWDYDGNELSKDVVSRYFKGDSNSLRIIKRK